MGCYDTVLVPCPKCGEITEFQSKSGDCLLNEYPLESCPSDVLANVNRHSPQECSRCHTMFEVKIVITATSVETNKTLNSQVDHTVEES